MVKLLKAILFSLLILSIFICGCFGALNVGQTAHLSYKDDKLAVTVTDVRVEEYQDISRFGIKTPEYIKLTATVNYKNSGDTKFYFYPYVHIRSIDAGKEMTISLSEIKSDPYSFSSRSVSLRPGNEETLQYEYKFHKSSDFWDYTLPALKNEAQLTIEWKDSSYSGIGYGTKQNYPTASWDIREYFSLDKPF